MGLLPDGDGRSHEDRVHEGDARDLLRPGQGVLEDEADQDLEEDAVSSG